MKLRIEPINNTNKVYVNTFNDCFEIDSKLELSLNEGHISYSIVPIPRCSKRYPTQNNSASLDEYIDNPAKIVFLAFIDNEVVGQISIKKNWNNYGLIEDIQVNQKYRRFGVGRALIAQAKSWAQKKNLPGLMLETQNNNVAACKFYEHCGFKIGGIDYFLYQGIQKNTDEAAIFWYWFC